MPLIAWWGDKIKEAVEINEYISLADIAPTFLDAAGVFIPYETSRKSFLPLIVPEKSSEQKANRDFVVTHNERHAWVHPGGQMAASRAIHMDDHPLIHNLFPDMWPAGHIDAFYHWDLYPFGDADGGRAKTELLKARFTRDSALFKLVFGKRPEFELYNVKADPFNLSNLADKEEFRCVKEKLQTTLYEYLLATNDPWLTGYTTIYYQAPCYAMKGLPTYDLFLEDWNSLDSL
ncbi:MAG TPA: hypothetical protein DDY13_14880 [Cytophagales bacterium]|mgnify:CR=1 FL=1|jgi:N-sulfoglucosamine sulfohydrolase|nr:hypothetical protein [Cytophagales bacterium]